MPFSSEHFYVNFGFIFTVICPINHCYNMQGSETFASWKANLLFEPVKFEVTIIIES